jgi:hypothetical protein
MECQQGSWCFLQSPLMWLVSAVGISVSWWRCWLAPAEQVFLLCSRDPVCTLHIIAGVASSPQSFFSKSTLPFAAAIKFLSLHLDSHGETPFRWLRAKYERSGITVKVWSGKSWGGDWTVWFWLRLHSPFKGISSGVMQRRWQHSLISLPVVQYFTLLIDTFMSWTPKLFNLCVLQISNLLHHFDIHLSSINPNRLLSILPWLVVNPTCDFRLVTYVRGEIYVLSYRQNFGVLHPTIHNTQQRVLCARLHWLCLCLSKHDFLIPLL